MKKISVPLERPIYEPVVFVNETEPKLESEIESEIESEPLDLDESKAHEYNLKKMKSFKQIRKKSKHSDQLSIYFAYMNKVLKKYDAKTNQLDIKLLILVLNVTEGFFIFQSKEEREIMKREAVIKIMKPYFRNDEEVLNAMIGCVWHRVKKSNIIKRFFKRLNMQIFF